MYKIGEFASKTGVTVKTLRYYNDIGLLEPSTKDPYTGYRYYTEKEIERYRKIEYLKELGFSLEEIRNNIDNMTVTVLNTKRWELINKRNFIDNQIIGLDELMASIEKSEGKIKTLKN